MRYLWGRLSRLGWRSPKTGRLDWCKNLSRSNRERLDSDAARGICWSIPASLPRARASRVLPRTRYDRGGAHRRIRCSDFGPNVRRSTAGGSEQHSLLGVRHCSGARRRAARPVGESASPALRSGPAATPMPSTMPEVRTGGSPGRRPSKSSRLGVITASRCLTASLSRGERDVHVGSSVESDDHPTRIRHSERIHNGWLGALGDWETVPRTLRGARMVGFSSPTCIRRHDRATGPKYDLCGGLERWR